MSKAHGYWTFQEKELSDMADTNWGLHLAQKAFFFCAFFLMTMFAYFNRPNEPSDMLSLLRRLASLGMKIKVLYYIGLWATPFHFCKQEAY